MRKLALAVVLPLAAAGLVLPGLFRPAQASAAAAAPAAAAQPDCLIPIFCPSPSPSPTPTPSGGTTPAPTPSASADPSPSASASVSPGGQQKAVPKHKKKATGPKKASSIKAKDANGLEISEAQFGLTTGTAVMHGATYDGTADVPTASGATVKMLKFSMTALDLTGSPTLTVSQGGQSAETSGSAMHFSGNVVLYVTKLTGHLLGIPLTLTPGSPLALFTSLLNGVPLTDVTTDQPVISANSLSIPGLQVNAG
ncbi:MAG TPA: hypothetical protein VIP48_20915 [Streptosporangiaceae bacterium]